MGGKGIGIFWGGSLAGIPALFLSELDAGFGAGGTFRSAISKDEPSVIGPFKNSQKFETQCWVKT